MLVAAIVCHFPFLSFPCARETGRSNEDAKEKGKRDWRDTSSEILKFSALSGPGGDGNTTGTVITVSWFSMLVGDGKGRCSAIRRDGHPAVLARDCRTRRVSPFYALPPTHWKQDAEEVTRLHFPLRHLHVGRS